MYILDIKRTAIGKFLGSLSLLSAPQIIKPLFKYFIDRYPFVKKSTNEVIIGNVLSAGIGMNPARIASYIGGLSEKIPAITINQVCGSGLTAIIQGSKSIALGDADIVMAGGMESMSNAPYLLKDARKGIKFGDNQLIDSLYHDGLFCYLVQSMMGQTAENITKKYKISRERQDKFAFESHQKAIFATDQGYFKNEIVHVEIGDGKEKFKFSVDEQLRRDTSIEKLSRLNSVFDKNGTVTAGNACGINDGAALAILVSDKAVKKYHLKPIAKILEYSYVGLDPKYMGLGAYYAVKALMKKSKLSLDEIDLLEINEAFAIQVLAVIDLLKVEPKKVNISGGAIALGHPIGASGARILTTLIYSLKKIKKKYGIAALCIGGGQGVAALIENL